MQFDDFDDEHVNIGSDQETKPPAEPKPLLDNWNDFQEATENNKSEGPGDDARNSDEEAAQDYLESLVGISHAKVSG